MKQEGAKNKTRRILWIALASILILYLMGYAVCRKTGVLVHTDWVGNADLYHSSHMIEARPDDSSMAKFAGNIFWPLREIEARCHSLRGRLD